ncbi:MAG: hypothetical protein K8R99_15800 [Actinomycetia bacterium]|nr:hypothetical protein [Actinomycetes bacterium]
MTDQSTPETDDAEIERDHNAPAAGRAAVLARRVGRRIVRRPSNWLNSPWPIERVVQYLTALVVVGGCIFAVLQVVHLNLVFTNNTPTGGDMGAHVMAPAYLRDHLLPHGQLTGWSNYWYNGFPIYRFYMVIPALMMVALNVIFPYGIAFKIVVCLGLVTLPFCCWAFGRLARFRYPVPELMALASLVFLFDESFSIYGGNVKSTMAGEFSFSIALSFAMLGLGLFARGLENGKYRSWAAIVLALAMLSHGIVLLFVMLAVALMWLVWMDKTRFWYGITVFVGVGLLVSFWVLPFVSSTDYMTDMKYGFRPDGVNDSFWDMFFPWSGFLDVVVSGLALLGFISSVIRRNLNGAWLGIMCIALMAATFLARDSLPGVGLLWNPRILPFLYLLRLLLMMVGIVDLVYFVTRSLKGRSLNVTEIWLTGAATATVVGVLIMSMELFLFRNFPGAELKERDGTTCYVQSQSCRYSFFIDAWGPISLTSTSRDALADGWTSYNFNGYEGRPAYHEYKSLVDAMAALGEDTDENLGCGRAVWENNGETGQYGTTMALMLLPHWTDGCITSQEGVFFEASATTPYHFLSVAAMSQNSSNPVRELRYTDNDADVGVPMLQKLGIKYVMLFTQLAKDEADGRDDLELVATSGPWEIYRVADSDVVVPLTVQPVVVNERSGDQRERNLELGTSWFQNDSEWAAMPAVDGPAEWQRIDAMIDFSRRVGEKPMDPGRRVDIVVPADKIKVVELPEIEVTNYHLGEQDLTFDVSQIGVPVLVKVSYFPNWEVDGADGPYRIGSNMMVVIPTSKHVRLHYEASTTDQVSYALTFLGFGWLIFWRIRGDAKHRNTHPFLVNDSDDWDEWDDDDDLVAVAVQEESDEKPVSEAPDAPSATL